ncbi:hypothetical protein Athai_01990 [Actinocatenispora thailandica]|uniref:DUF3159 domain-containing protein n=1 Tax=Actinocatenispora thailandica TaxID=227318 RepID=A0A7R7DJH8_9ACTN|nr:hypothetical protein [Actinocatenispora thailandica]BCJ32696.1 hypothetical protein Athai_01990 [Actinocatenispora thailandica]
MSYLLAFAPWIVYAVIPASQWRWGALTALVLTAATLAWSIARRRPLGSMIIQLGSVAFFAAATALAFLDPHTGLHPYLPALSNGWLAVISWFSLAIRQPFTMGIARLDTPREVWHQPLFIRTNVVVTLVWAIAFTLGAAALAGCGAFGASSTAVVTVQVASFVIPIVFTIRYVAAVQRRVAQLRSQAGAAQR